MSMSSTRRLITPFALMAFGILSNPSVDTFADDAPTVDQIMDKYIEATGGKANYEKIKNTHTKGTLEFPAAGLKGTVSVYVADPIKLYSETELEGVGVIKNGTDGETAWEVNPLTGARIMTAAERDGFLRSAALHSELKWKEMYEKSELKGTEEVDGKLCYKVVFSPKEGAGSPETKYFDKQSGLLTKVTATVNSPMGDIATESYPTNYQEVDGLKLPFKTTQKVLTQEIVITIDSVKFNVEIPKDKFDLPAEIKTLKEKK